MGADHASIDAGWASHGAGRIIVVEADDRTIEAEAVGQIITVAADDRTIALVAENRVILAEV
jgi:hypothetical protein